MVSELRKPTCFTDKPHDWLERGIWGSLSGNGMLFRLNFLSEISRGNCWLCIDWLLCWISRISLRLAAVWCPMMKPGVVVGFKVTGVSPWIRAQVNRICLEVTFYRSVSSLLNGIYRFETSTIFSCMKYLFRSNLFCTWMWRINGGVLETSKGEYHVRCMRGKHFASFSLRRFAAALRWLKFEAGIVIGQLLVKVTNSRYVIPSWCFHFYKLNAHPHRHF